MDAQFTGNKITEKRKALNLTQKDISEKLHVSISAVSKWERGLNFPDLSLMEPLSEVLEVTVAELLGIENETPQNVIREITEISAIETREYKKSTLVKTVLAATAVVVLLVILSLIVMIKEYMPYMNEDISLVLSTAVSGFFLAFTWIFSFISLVYGIKTDSKKCMAFSFLSTVSFYLSYLCSFILQYLITFIRNTEFFMHSTGFVLLNNLFVHAGPFVLLLISWLVIKKRKAINNKR